MTVGSVAAKIGVGGAVEVTPAPDVGAPVMSPADMGELLAAFNEVTAKLQRSHEKLHGEVARLTRELADANAQIERGRRLAALGEMAAGIAHEVRNPLGSIRLYARLLEQDLVERPEQRDTAVKIARSVGAIEQIVGDVLSFAREHRLERQDLDGIEALERALEASGYAGHPEWRRVNVEIARGRMRTVRADAHLLHQALLNVIRNAFEAMEAAPAGPGGHVLRLGVESGRDGSVAFVVRDSGPGVTPEVVARMFNPFFTTRSAGTGLGLAIVHRIVDAHSGAVLVRNNRDLGGGDATAPGACVELVFPASEERSPAMERATSGSADAA